MRVIALDHLNIHTAKIDETVRFYMDALGLSHGAMPQGLPADDGSVLRGAWLYDEGGRAILHVISDADGAPATPSPIDHFALDCVGRDDFMARLSANDVPFEVCDFPQFKIRQLVVHDPNGIKIELGFRAEADGFDSTA